jgi:hypothetical protein
MVAGDIELVERIEPIELGSDAFSLGLIEQEGGRIRGISGAEMLPRSLYEIEMEFGWPIAPLPQADLGGFGDVSAGDEEEEEERGVLPNFGSVMKCVSGRVRPAQVVGRIQKILKENDGKHFVVLLLEPEFSVEGVYVFGRSLKVVTKVWGDTPDVIADDEPIRFWMYNGLTDQFVEQEERLFSPFTDAVSMSI